MIDTSFLDEGILTPDRRAPSLPAAAYYPMDDGGGAVVTPLVGLYPGTITGATWVDGPTGKVLRSVNATSGVRIASDVVNLGAKAVALWIKPTGTAWVWDRVFSTGVAGSSGGKFVIYLHTSTYAIGATNDAATLWWSPSNAVVVNNWSHVVIARNAADKLSIYVNGALKGAADQAAGTPAAVAQTVIGNTPALTTGFLGDMGAVSVYGELTAEQIAALFAAEKATYGL